MTTRPISMRPVIGDDDSPEHYGFPAKITGELAGEQNAYLLRDENNDLFVTEKKSDIVVFEYAMNAIIIIFFIS